MQITDHLGNEFDSIKECALFHNIPYSTLYKRIMAGISIEDALTQTNGVIYKGIHYASLHELCNLLNIKTRSFYDYKHKHPDKPLDVLIDNYIKSTRTLHKYIAPDGKEYRSFHYYCKSIGINPYTVKHRKEIMGLTDEEAFSSQTYNLAYTDKEIEIINKYYPLMGTDCVKYLPGRKADNIRAYATSHNIKCTIKQQGKRNRKEITDHLGNKYSSIVELADAYSIDVKILRSRLYRGMTMENALTTPVKHRNIGFVTDHLGNKYSSLKSMCQKYGVTVKVYTNRIKKGMSIKNALTVPMEPKTELPYRNKYSVDGKYVDHLNNKYDSIKQLCRYYNINPEAYKRRINSGWDLKYALLTPLKLKMYKSSIGVIKSRYLGCLNGVPFYECECSACKDKFILNPLQILEHIKCHD